LNQLCARSGIKAAGRRLVQPRIEGGSGFGASLRPIRIGLAAQ
jgi:hypothetical protein